MNNYSGKKVAILRGYPRLIDGESTSVEEMFLWGLENDVEFHTYYYHSPWKRKKPEYKDGYLHKCTIFSRENIDEIVNEINNKYDLVILINPAKPHSGLKKEDVFEFHKMYKRITPVKVQMQHTSFVKAIKETPFCWSYINESDAVYNHSSESYYMNALVKKLPSKKDRAFPMHLWTNVKKYQNFYKNTVREKNLTYIGRFVLYKGPRRLLDISEAVHKAGIQPVIYGMDTGIGCKQQILSHPNCNNLLQPTLPKNENPIVPTYGRIEREEVLNKFNQSLFACTLFKFKTGIDKSFYGDRLEYTMQEAICAGAILVVDKEWAEECKTVDGVRYIDIPNFAIYMDEKNPHDAIQEMKKVAESPELQQLYRDTAFKVLLNEYDNSIVLPKLMNQLFNITKDPYKFEGDFELVEYLTKSISKAEKFIELYKEGNLMPMVPGAIDTNKISIFTGKSGKAIREVV
ncbi:glycosyltransferase [Geobacillus phage GR1]|nr:glycosyltransferase [Geobacillus phage GR1]